MKYYWHRSTGLLCAVILSGWWFLSRIELNVAHPVLFAKIHQQRGPISSLDQPRNTAVVSDLLLDVVDFPKGSEFRHLTLGRLGFREHFFVDLTGKLELPEPQAVVFKIRSDDGFRMSIQGRVICEAPQPQPLRTTTCEAQLTAGTHQWEIRYFQAGGGMGLRARYSTDNAQSFKLFGKSSESLQFVPLMRRHR